MIILAVLKSALFRLSILDFFHVLVFFDTIRKYSLVIYKKKKKKEGPSVPAQRTAINLPQSRQRGEILSPNTWTDALAQPAA